MESGRALHHYANQEEMKHYLLAFLVMFLAICPALGQKSFIKDSAKSKPGIATGFQTKHNVSGKILITNPYCGGPAPTEEMTRLANTPLPFAGCKLYVRADTFNNAAKPVIAEFVADTNGNFSIQLPPGKYCLIQEEQLKPIKSSDLIKDRYHAVSSEKCVQEWWGKGLLVFEVKDTSLAGVDTHFYRQCHVQTFCPCVYYDGPIPN